MSKRRPFRRTTHRLRNISVRVSRPLLFRIGQVVDELGCTRNAFIRRAIVTQLEQHAASHRFGSPPSDT